MNKRRVSIAAGVACLVLLAAFFMVKFHYESKVKGNIENFLATLPEPLSVKTETIDVSFFDRSVTLTNLTGTFTMRLPDVDGIKDIPVEFTFDRISASGVNMDGFKEGAGAAKLVDRVTITGATSSSPIARTAIKEYVLENISADFALIVTGLAKATPIFMTMGENSDGAPADPQSKTLAALADFLEAYETVTIGKSSFKEYAYSLPIEHKVIDVTIEMMEVRDYSIRTMGPFVMKNIVASMDGTAFTELGSIAADGLVLPSFVELLRVLAASPSASPAPFQAHMALKGQEFAVKNLRVDNFSLHHPLAQDVLIASLAGMRFSYIAGNTHTMDFSFTNFTLNQAALRDAAGLHPLVREALPETIRLEGAVRQRVTLKESMACDLDIEKIHIKGPGLGEASLSLAANDVNLMALMMGAGSGTLKNFTVSLADDGLSTALFAANAADNGESAAQLREREVNALRQSLSKEETVGGKKVLAAIITFLERPGGTFAMTITPATPATLEALAAGFASDPGSIGLTVTATAGK